jgi:hypothetical protein
MDDGTLLIRMLIRRSANTKSLILYPGHVPFCPKPNLIKYDRGYSSFD